MCSWVQPSFKTLLKRNRIQLPFALKKLNLHASQTRVKEACNARSEYLRRHFVIKRTSLRVPNVRIQHKAPTRVRSSDNYCSSRVGRRHNNESLMILFFFSLSRSLEPVQNNHNVLQINRHALTIVTPHTLLKHQQIFFKHFELKNKVLGRFVVF